MKNLRNLFCVVALLAAASVPALGGNLETPPAPTLPPPATEQMAPASDGGNLETPPLAVIAEAALGIVLSVTSIF